MVVTGATSGLGAAMAEALLAAGATVALGGRPGARLDAAAARDDAAVPLAMDVRDEESVERAADQVWRRWGGVDLVVNNAGIGMRTVNPRFLTDPQPFWQVGPQGFRDVVETNLTGYFLVARAFAPRMVEQGSGRFLTITMNHETMQRPGFVPYGPSRAGAESLSAIMSEDLRPYGIAVNMLLPGGATESGMIPDDLPEQARAGLLPASVMGPPAVFFASAQAAGVTGERVVATEWDAWLAAHRG